MDNDDIFSASTGSRRVTPTQSETSEKSFQGSSFNDESPNEVPWAGKTLMICHAESGRVVTLKDGVLQLKQVAGGEGGWHWICEAKDGWLCFRNVVSGTYLGHDGRGKFIAGAQRPQSWEYFVAKHHPSGGYRLMTLHGWRFKEMEISGMFSPSLVYKDNSEGAIWHFLNCSDATSPGIYTESRTRIL